MQNPSYLKNRRLRLFAGPNGSGKSTILNQIKHKFDVGIYINADEIEKSLNSNLHIDLIDFGINKLNESKFNKIISEHSIVKKSKSEGYIIDFKLDGTKIINPDNQTHSYEAALLADIIRNELVSLGKKFTFETVMSHKSKIDLLKKSLQLGYKNYLYFVSTESPIINIERVEQRVKMGGHPVSKSKIESRYYNSLKLLHEALQYTYRAFIFDNSNREINLILEIYNGEIVTYNHPEIPKWIDNYIFNRNV